MKRAGDRYRMNGFDLDLDVILHGVTDGVAVLQPDGRFVYVNEAGAKLSGFGTAEEFLSADPREILGRFELSDESGASIEPAMLPGRMALEGMRSPPERLIRFLNKKTGEVRWSLVSAAPIFDESGKVKSAISIFRDFTERRRSEEALQLLARSSVLLASSLDYRDTLKSVARMVVPSLADWCVIAVQEPGEPQPRSVALAHLDPEREAWGWGVEHKYPTDWSRSSGPGEVIRTGRPELYPWVPPESVASAGRTQEHRELLGALGLRSVMIVPLKVREGTLGAMTLMSTSSGRLYSRADLAVAEDLAHRAGQAVESALQYRRAQRSIEARTEFLSIASHELKTPLTSLRLQLEMARRRIEGGAASVENLFHVLEVACRQVDRLSLLVEDMLDVSRIESGRLSLSIDKVSLSEVVRDVVERFQAQFADGGIQPRVMLAEVAPGDWDRNRLEQVAANLLANALKHAPRASIEIRVEGDDERALLLVRDDGPGIPPEHQSSIFERFHRAAAPQNVAGLGLGLYIVRQIVEAHGGTVRVRSERGRGAEFIVALPLRPDFSAARPGLPVRASEKVQCAKS